MKWIFIAVAAYLLGSVSPAIIISKYIKKRDVRREGSGNAGSTNMARVFGMKIGAVAFAFDLLKTFASLAIGQVLTGQNGVYLAGACCFLGHCKPVYYKFRGGKGVATAAAIAIYTDWRVFLAGAVMFFLVFLWRRRVSLSSIMGIAGAIAATLLFRWGDVPYLCLILFLGTLVIYFHRSNIKRLIAGTEPEFRVKP